MSDAAGVARVADRIEAWLARTWPLWIARGIDPVGPWIDQLDDAGRARPSPVPASTRTT